MKTLKLLNGKEIPMIGYGTFRSKAGDETKNGVLEALKVGYRHIDGAAIYKNEKSVGEAIKESGVPREEIFVTSKLWNDNKGYEETKAAFQKTLDDLGLDYLDLYLIHWPVAKASKDHWQQANADTWRAFEELYEEGKIKAIGVSNFLKHHLEELDKTARIKPMVNQIEIHPGKNQDELVAYCKERGIVLEAWAPFSAAKALDHPTLVDIAAKYNKITAQVILRWLFEKDIVSLPKSVTPSRIAANIDIFDFTLAQEDKEKIDGITGVEGSKADPDAGAF